MKEHIVRYGRIVDVSDYWHEQAYIRLIQEREEKQDEKSKDALGNKD